MLTPDQIRKFPLFAGLNDAECVRLAPLLTRRQFARGAYLFYPGNPGMNTYLVESGQVRVFFTNAAGQEFILNLIGPGETFGLSLIENDQLRVIGAATYTPAVVLSIARDDLMRMMDGSAQLIQNVFMDMTTSSRKLLLHTRMLATISVDGRLATMLLRLSRKDDQVRDEIILPLSQTELAGWVGASRGRLNRVMKNLQQMKLIRVEGQKIWILDRAGLERMTEEAISDSL